MDNKTFGYKQLIVPNIVHYVLFTIHEIEFAHFISILSVLKNQRPEIIYIHCDCHQISGQYFQRVLKVADKVNTKVIVRYVDKPTEIFGKKLKDNWINWYIMPIKVLIEFGGIYLDNDIYVVKSLDVFRKNKITLYWDTYMHLDNQLIIAHKKTAFLKVMLNLFYYYDNTVWYFIREFVTKDYLMKRPELVVSMAKFGFNGTTVCHKLYQMYYKDWKTEFYAIHMLLKGNKISTYNKFYCFGVFHWIYQTITEFDEHSVRQLNITFSEMCGQVFDFEYNLIH
ncbi:uncharacterized protein LOC128966498 [Oppia nitens]|uniref:uncharacterized protein LOC128966498 n=1 Tax=Oppia nitens TaxID=1686743 RepID=UPI0023DA8FFF|nr:uncharacterized protein LOC128966498 [Oppia nitens]